MGTHVSLGFVLIYCPVTSNISLLCSLSLFSFLVANYSDINPFKSSHSSWMLCSVILFFLLLSYGFDRLTLRLSRSACVSQVKPQALRPVLTADPWPVHIPSPLLGMDFSVPFFLATTCFTSVLTSSLMSKPNKGLWDRRIRAC